MGTNFDLRVYNPTIQGEIQIAVGSRDWRKLDESLMADSIQEIELVFEPQDDGGYRIYAPDLPGLHTQGNDLDEAMANAGEAVNLYVEGLREDGDPFDSCGVRLTIPLPA